MSWSRRTTALRAPSSFKLEIGVTGRVPTTFTKVIGHENMYISVTTEIVWGVKKLELALALDVTGSMASNNKMTELKKAAKSLLTTLKAAAKKDGDIKVAIVPFAVVVNAGSANVAAASLGLERLEFGAGDHDDLAGDPEQ